MAQKSFEIPLSIQALILRMYFQQHSIRQIYLHLWPSGTTPPVQLAAFTRAVNDLVLKNEEQVMKLAQESGVPSMQEFADAMGSEDKLAKLALMPAVAEMPLTPGDTLALEQLDLARSALLQEMHKCATEPLPDTVEALEGKGESAEMVVRARGGWDPRSVRAAAVATLANAVAANVALRLKASEVRTKRTIDMHNLRLARVEEVQKAEREAKKNEKIEEIVDRVLPPAPFEVDIKH